jgi:tRNA G46 methylase TrmB
LECLLGKHTSPLDASAFQLLQKPYTQTWVDIGAGDGRFVLHAARVHPDVLAIGVDACRENLAGAARKTPPNALFLIANALALPEEHRTWPRTSPSTSPGAACWRGCCAPTPG